MVHLSLSRWFKKKTRVPRYLTARIPYTYLYSACIFARVHVLCCFFRILFNLTLTGQGKFRFLFSIEFVQWVSNDNVRYCWRWDCAWNIFQLLVFLSRPLEPNNQEATIQHIFIIVQVANLYFKWKIKKKPKSQEIWTEHSHKIFLTPVYCFVDGNIAEHHLNFKSCIHNVHVPIVHIYTYKGFVIRQPQKWDEKWRCVRPQWKAADYQPSWVCSPSPHRHPPNCNIRSF